MRRCGVAVAAVLLAIGAQQAGAVPTESGETGLVTIPTADVLAPWTFHAGVYENGDATSNPGDIELGRTEFLLGVGLLPNLEFTSMIPYVQFERDVPGDRHTDGAGGLRLGLKYRLLDEATGAPVSVALLGAVVVGTGRDSFPAILDRNSAWGRRETYEIMGVLDKVVWKTAAGKGVTLTLNAGGLFFDQPQSFSVQNQSLQFQRRFVGPNATFTNPFEFAVGLKLPVLAIRDFQADFLAEWRGNTGIVDEVRGALPTWLFSGVRLSASNGLALQGGGDFGLSGFLEPYRFIVGLTYALPPAAPSQPLAQASPAPMPSPAPTPGPARAVAKQKIVLRGVNFDYDRATIRRESVPTLQAAADTLKEHPTVRILIVGYTDSKGSPAYNQRLGLRRAAAVRAALERLGVQANRMDIESKGESQPVASNATEDGRAQNRRVELLVES